MDLRRLGQRLPPQVRRYAVPLAKKLVPGRQALPVSRDSFASVVSAYGHFNRYSACLLGSVYKDTTARVNLAVPEFDPDSLFAGVKTAIEVAAKIATSSGYKPRLVAVVPDRIGLADPAAFQQHAEETLNTITGRSDWQFVPRSKLAKSTFSFSDVWIATHWTTAHAIDVAARARLVDRGSVAYLIQDFEPGFLPQGSDSALASGTYDAGFVHLVNSTPVAKSLVSAGHGRVDPRRVFSPSFDLEELQAAANARAAKQTARIFFYGRPSKPRNMYALGVAALGLAAARLVKAGVSVEFVMAGEAGPDVDLGPLTMKNLGILPRADYFTLLSTVDVGLSLQASPHPSHPPFDLAISGATAVTNEVGGTRGTLHPRVTAVTADPEALARALVAAVQEPGTGDFLPPRSGVLGSTLSDAVDSTWAELARRRQAAATRPPAALPKLDSRRAQVRRVQRKSTAAWKEAEELSVSPAFDAAFYAGCAGLRTTHPVEIAHHFVTRGQRRGLSIHPLIEPEYLGEQFAASLRAGTAPARALLTRLEAPDATRQPWGPLFDPQALGCTTGEEALEALRRLPEDQPLPVPEGFIGQVPTLADARAAARQHSQRLRAMQGRGLRPLTAWDTTAEATYRAATTTVTDGPLVSVIMPVWNRATQVADAIASVRAQTYTNWELVVVDDGSTDDSVEAVGRLIADEPRARLVGADHLGAAATRNRGLQESQGSYVAFLDSDNTWRPDFLEYAVSTLVAEPELTGAFTGQKRLEDDDVVSYLGGKVTATDLAYGNSIDMNVLVVPRAVIDEVGTFDVELKRWVDFDLVLRIAARGEIRYVPIVGCDYDNRSAADRITRKESPNWQFVVLSRQAMDWDAMQASLETRVAGRVSVVMIAYEDHVMTLKAVDEVLRTTEGEDVEVVVLDNGSRYAVGRVITTRYANHPRVRYHRLPRNLNFATGCNVGALVSTGEFVFFLNNDTLVLDGWLSPLREHLVKEPALAVQPLLIYPNGEVQTAGTVFNVRNGGGAHFLARHPREDAERADCRGFSAITAGAMLIRASDFTRLRGFDPLYANGGEDVDFCLRAVRDLGATFDTVVESVVMHEESRSPGRFRNSANNDAIFRSRWDGKLPSPERDAQRYRDLGFEWSHIHTLGYPSPVVNRRRQEVEVAGFGVIPSLRWAIKIGAKGTDNHWGDVPFAADLAAALRRLGQEVVVNRADANNGALAYLDDVVLTIRGMRPMTPRPGRVNLMWVISRAERLSVDEVRGYDATFAASPRWADYMAREAGCPVDVLLQATSPERFNPSITPTGAPSELLFVGIPRAADGGRPVVQAALEAGAELSLWGPGWRELVAPELVSGDFLPFAEAPGYYRSTKLLLNDHHDDMRDWGFINNRVFDAVATGIPVLSDYVEGLEMFSGVVRAARDKSEIVDALQDRSWIPAADEVRRVSDWVRAEHSFDRRAEQLLRKALELHSRLAG